MFWCSNDTKERKRLHAAACMLHARAGLRHTCTFSVAMEKRQRASVTRLSAIFQNVKAQTAMTVEPRRMSVMWCRNDNSGVDSTCCSICLSVSAGHSPHQASVQCYSCLRVLWWVFVRPSASAVGFRELFWSVREEEKSRVFLGKSGIRGKEQKFGRKISTAFGRIC